MNLLAEMKRSLVKLKPNGHEYSFYSSGNTEIVTFRIRKKGISTKAFLEEGDYFS
jgi:hypothetical protein